MNKIEKLEKQMAELKRIIAGLERDIDGIMEDIADSSKISRDIRNLQEAVANISEQPVGMMFDYRVINMKVVYGILILSMFKLIQWKLLRTKSKR